MIAPMNIHLHPPQRSSRAFTLIEMLVVIAIIGILAALILVAGPAAIRKMRFARVEGEKEALITIIEKYKARKNFYPPDNTNLDAVLNPLYYELGGAKQLPNGNFVSLSQENLTPGSVANLFGRDGFINSSGDPAEVENFLKASLKNSQFATVTNQSATFTILGVPIQGPIMLKKSDGTATINPWRYVSSHATNNDGSFDLWMDITIGGQVYRISNWSKEPQPL
jgi:prepilin-type N-terminal cleavage/methylation domain-containing protein